MRFMIIVKATKDSEAGVMPGEKLLAAMAAYHEELAKAGVLLDASGLQASAKEWRVEYSGDQRRRALRGNARGRNQQGSTRELPGRRRE